MQKSQVDVEKVKNGVNVAMPETLAKLREWQVVAVDLRLETEEKDNLVYIVPSATNLPASQAFKEHHFEKE